MEIRDLAAVAVFSQILKPALKDKGCNFYFVQIFNSIFEQPQLNIVKTVLKLCY